MTYSRQNPCPGCGHNEFMPARGNILDQCLQCGQDDLPNTLKLNGQPATPEQLAEQAAAGFGQRRDELLCYGRKGWIRGNLADGTYFDFSV